MKISEIITEATGPERIHVGGKRTIPNPAYMPSVKYEGDPSGYNFGAQQKYFDEFSTALARNGQKFTYIGVAKSKAGPDTFVVISPTLIWQKYEGYSPGGGTNNVYALGNKIKATDFIKFDKQKQDMLLSGTSSIESFEQALLSEKNVSKYIKGLLNSNFDKAEIIKSLEKNKELILKIFTGMILYSFHDRPELLKTINNLIKSVQKYGINLNWLTLSYWLENDLFPSLEKPPNMSTYFIRNMEILVRQLPESKELVANFLNSIAGTLILVIINDQYGKFSENLMRLVNLGFHYNGLDHHKKDIIKAILTSMTKNIDNSKILDSIIALQKSGIEWPELTTIKNSIESDQ